MDKLSGYRLFSAIVESKSLKGAAQALNVTPSAVSKHLARLENHYNIDLVYRDSKTIRLTQEGKVFYRLCHSVLMQIDEGERMLSKEARDREILRITVAQAFGNKLFYDALREFKKLYPQVQFQISFNNQMEDLQSNKIDFAFRGGKLPISNLKFRKMISTKTILCTSPYGKRSFKSLEELCGHLLIPNYINLHELKSYLKSIGWAGNLSDFSSINDAYAYKQAVLQGVGIGIFLESFVADEITQKKLLIIKEPADFHYKNVDQFIVYKKNVKLGAINSKFLKFMIERYK